MLAFVQPTAGSLCLLQQLLFIVVTFSLFCNTRSHPSRTLFCFVKLTCRDVFYKQFICIFIDVNWSVAYFFKPMLGFCLYFHVCVQLLFDFSVTLSDLLIIFAPHRCLTLNLSLCIQTQKILLPDVILLYYFMTPAQSSSLCILKGSAIHVKVCIELLMTICVALIGN